jgi:hypothetical protein
MPIHNLKEYLKARYREQREAMIEFLGGKCISCGSTKDLQFDHKDPKRKKFNVGGLWGYNNPDIVNELLKCQLLCKSCHSKKSATETSIRNSTRGFTHGTQYGWMVIKCQCELCLGAKWKFHDIRNTKRRKGNGYKTSTRRQIRTDTVLNLSQVPPAELG